MSTVISSSPSALLMPLSALPLLDARTIASIRTQMALEHCKWDPQVGDHGTLAPFALSMSQAQWQQLSDWSESLARETAAAETELLGRFDLHARLGMPRAVRRLLRGDRINPTSAAARTIRFDFHWTTDGWQISEANTDVPGGFTEASSFTRLMAEQYPQHTMPGDPAAAWADAIAKQSRAIPIVALLAASGFMEDQQIMAYLALLLRCRGITAHLADPKQIQWQNGHASLNTNYYAGPVGTIVRFYQAEWIARLPRRIGWEHYFINGRTPVANPATAMLTESKRFALTWPDLKTTLPTWGKLLPETRDPRDVPWRSDDRWLLKTAFCNTGDSVSVRSLLTPRQWNSVRRNIWWQPGSWVAQRKFESIPIDTPLGSMHACVGVYTVDGRAAGAYTRLSRTPVIDYASTDVALLIEPQREW